MFQIKKIRKYNNNILESELTSEITFTGISSETECTKYLTWITFLLSFISGKNINFIYQTLQGILEGQNGEIEYWIGMSQDIKKNNIAVIQRPLFNQFFDKVGFSINDDLFDTNGLGLALYWYLEKFGNGSVSTKFIFLCTALETLISSFKNNHQNYEQVSERLLSKPCYRTIRDQVLNLVKDNKNNLQEQLRDILENHKETLENDDLDTIIDKYELFCLKLEKSFSNFNMLGNLSDTLKEMLHFYNVKYDDLFPKLDFPKIRNDIIHEGFHEQDAVFSSGSKLENLFIRLVLAMLEYEGEYQKR
jgi:hypothetical protein